jgi:hypothetical protein
MFLHNLLNVLVQIANKMWITKKMYTGALTKELLKWCFLLGHEKLASEWNSTETMGQC